MPKFKPKRTKYTDKKRTPSERIPESTINYYRRVSETLSEEFSSLEERDIFLTNVSKQLQEDGLGVFKLSIISRLMERLVDLSDKNHIESLLNLYSSDWTMMITDRFASHVLQCSIGRIPHLIQTSSASVPMETYDDESEEGTKLSDIFLTFCEHLLENFSNYWTDTYGSHIIREVLQVLGGVAVDEHVIRSQVSRDQKRGESQNKVQFKTFQPPASFKVMLQKFNRKIFKDSNLQELTCSELTSPVIQTALLILQRVKNKKCQKYLNKLVSTTKLLEPMENKTSLPDIAANSVGSFLVEQILNLSSEELYKQVYKEAFKGRLLCYGVHPGANFILQRLISNVKEKEHFEEILVELCPCLEDLLAVNHFGVITKLAEGCYRLGCKQEKLVKSLMAAFHCAEPVERQTKLTVLLLSMSTYEIFFETDSKEETSDKDTQDEKKPGEAKIPLLQDINYHGSLLMQQLLRFGNPKIITTGLMELKPVELHRLSCDPCGSHVIDVFFQSSSIGEKSRDLLLARMKTGLMEMACSRNGSRTLENIWKLSTGSQKVVIATELGRQEAKLRSDQYGRYVHRNFGISQFMTRRKDWKDNQANSQKKRKLFKDIFSDDSSRKKFKKGQTEHECDEDQNIDEQNIMLQDEDKSVATSNAEKLGLPESMKVKPSGKVGEALSKDQLDSKRKKSKFSNEKVKNTGEYKIKDKRMQSLLSEVEGRKYPKKKKKKHGK